MGEKSARCDALRNVCVLVVLREQPWRTASRKGNSRHIVDLSFPHVHEKARSTSRGHLELSALPAISWCFDSSVRQGSRGLLLHRHCVALAGRPRIHVAVQPSSGLRSIAMMYTKLLHSITYLMFFCVMKVADRLNSDLLSSVSTLQITVLF